MSALKVSLGIVDSSNIQLQNLCGFFRQQPEMEVLLSTSSVEALIDSLLVSRLNLILISEDSANVELVRKLKRKNPEAKVILLGESEKIEDLIKLLAAGVSSVVSRKSAFQSMKQALLTTYRGEAYLSPSMTYRIVEFFRTEQDPPRIILSERQLDIVSGLTEGLSYKMIANELGISIETVRDHIKKIYRCLGVNNKAAVIRMQLKGVI
ncbi:MAG: response regulator transcription factor [Saprospiraceae bacterium]|nr:response regulator transcription factor [Saprospiraceae bacterium]